MRGWKPPSQASWWFHISIWPGKAQLPPPSLSGQLLGSSFDSCWISKGIRGGYRQSVLIRGVDPGTWHRFFVGTLRNHIDSTFITTIATLLFADMYDPIWNLENLLHGSTCGISQPIPLDSIIEFEDAPQDEEPFEFEPFVWHSYRDPPTLLQGCQSAPDGDEMRPLPFDSLECSQTYPSRIPSVTMTRPDPSVYIPIHDPQTRPYLCPYYEHDREKFVACQKVKYKAASHIRCVSLFYKPLSLI